MAKKRRRRRPYVRWSSASRDRGQKVTTLIIGTEADFRGRQAGSTKEADQVLRKLKEYINLSYDTESVIASQLGVNDDTLARWLSGKAKPASRSLLKIRGFLETEPEEFSGEWPQAHRLRAQSEQQPKWEAREKGIIPFRASDQTNVSTKTVGLTSFRNQSS